MFETRTNGDGAWPGKGLQDSDYGFCTALGCADQSYELYDPNKRVAVAVNRQEDFASWCLMMHPRK
jgi:hypothetical protein